jgi:hypothetical protein
MAPDEVPASVHKLYLRDLGCLIKELAVESKQAATESQSDFATGYMAGFHRVVSLMQQQAEAFEIPLGDIALDGFDPDSELV